MIGTIFKETPVSRYQPPQEVKEFTHSCQQDFEQGYDIIHKSYVELNDMSPIDRDARDKKTFNAFVDESVEEPTQAWKWRGTRSKARNKAIAMHSQITAGYIVPMFMAQNDDDEQDIGFSDLMRDIAEWMVENSNYKSSFLQVSMGMLINSVTYLGAEYAEVYQKVKVRTAQGWTKEEILDEVLSGFQAPVYTSDQVYISNAYEQNIQRHRFNISARWIEYAEAKAKYGEHEYWEFVQPGVSTVFNSEDGKFYDIKDDDHPTLIQEIAYKNRGDDTEVCFLGGIYMGDSDVEANPIKHRDNRNAPKYNIVPFGYQRITEHFYFYKSLMNAQYWDNNLYDAQSELLMNRGILETNMPIAVSGSDKIDSEVMFPSAVVTFADKDTRVTPLLPPANFAAGFKVLEETGRSMDEASVSDVSAGQLPDGNTKATALNIAQQNAQILLKGVGKTLAESIVQYGGLMADIAVNHLSIPQIDQIVGDTQRLKYRKFILKNKVVSGRNVSKEIRFKDSFLGRSMGEDEKKQYEIDLAIEGGYPKSEKAIYDVNPEVFAKMKYLVSVVPEKMFPKNEEYMQALNTQMYTLLRQDPLISGEALVREVLHSVYQGKTDQFIAKQPAVIPGQGQNPQDPNAPKTPGSQLGNMAMQKSLAGGLPT